MHIVLIGDSIFDNRSYVDEGESVLELLTTKMPNADVSMLAVDGDITTDVHQQLTKLPSTATNLFLSCGGNDAIRSVGVLSEETSTVGSALEILFETMEKFRVNYVSMLEAVLDKNKNLTACTIYNKVPGLNKRVYTALALFNEVILEELTSRGVPIIDLRVICNEPQDYSSLSTIEPSFYGGNKIVESIASFTKKVC